MNTKQTDATESTAGAAPTLILLNGRFHTVDKSRPVASAVAIKDGKFLAVGDAEDVMRHRTSDSQVIDLNGRTAIPGLNDSHLHLIRGGLNYNLELRWEGGSQPQPHDAVRPVCLAGQDLLAKW